MMRRWFIVLALLFSPLAQAVVLPAGATRILGVIIWFADTTTYSVGVVGLGRQLFTNPDSVAAFWLENSYGAAQITGSVHPKILRSAYTLSSGKCGPVLYTEVRNQLAAQGVTPDQYDYLVVSHPGGSPGCRWDAVGLIDAAYLNGGVSTRTMAHEIGHAMRIFAHANTVIPQTTAGTLGRTNVAEYGNRVDIMGNSRYMHSNAYNKSQLGYLAGRAFEHTSGKATYSIKPIESTDGNVAVKVGSGAAYLWIEYRQPIGFDAKGLPATSADGLLYYGGALVNLYGVVSIGLANRLCSPCLVNTHYPFGAFPLKAGETYTDTLAKAKVTVDALTPETMTVTVESL